MLKPDIKNGYYYVNLYKNGTPRHYYVHRLIAEAFIPNPNNKPEINHKNGVKTDNRIANLEYCTAKENVIHAYKTKLNKRAKQILQYKSQGNFIKSWASMREAETQLKVYHICDCCKGKRLTAGGYIWRYKENT